MGHLEQLNFKPVKKGTWVKCYNPKCLYQWEYKGDMQYGCCPSCRHNVKVDYGNQFFVLNQIQKNNLTGVVQTDSQAIAVASTVEAGRGNGGDKS